MKDERAQVVLPRPERCRGEPPAPGQLPHQGISSGQSGGAELLGGNDPRLEMVLGRALQPILGAEEQGQPACELETVHHVLEGRAQQLIFLPRHGEVFDQ